jgi:hypothetical protein
MIIVKLSANNARPFPSFPRRSNSREAALIAEEGGNPKEGLQTPLTPLVRGGSDIDRLLIKPCLSFLFLVFFAAKESNSVISFAI